VSPSRSVWLLALAAVVVGGATVALAQQGPDTEEAEEARLEAIAARAELRAFEGAPPVISHPVDEADNLYCTDCHSDGSEGAVADPMLPHGGLVSCRQCHVESLNDRFEGAVGEPAQVANSFHGRRRVQPVAAASVLAPPPTPHTTWMRGTCVACHGPAGPEGLRTPHLERVMCLQCHAPSAELDQR
jgi:cytochrome c-type protein NapB